MDRSLPSKIAKLTNFTILSLLLCVCNCSKPGNFGSCHVPENVQFSENNVAILKTYSTADLEANYEYYLLCLEVGANDASVDGTHLREVEKELVRRGNAKIISQKYLSNSDWGKKYDASLKDLEVCAFRNEPDCWDSYIIYLRGLSTNQKDKCQKYELFNRKLTEVSNEKASEDVMHKAINIINNDKYYQELKSICQGEKQ